MTFFSILISRHRDCSSFTKTLNDSGVPVWSLCAACHGESAKGGVGPDLTVSKYKYGKARLDITKTISEGRPGGMPSFSSQIDKEQVEGIVEFVLTLK